MVTTPPTTLNSGGMVQVALSASDTNHFAVSRRSNAAILFYDVLHAKASDLTLA